MRRNGWRTRNSVTVRELVATVNLALDRHDTLGIDVSPEVPAESAFGSDHRVQIGAGERSALDGRKMSLRPFPKYSTPRSLHRSCDGRRVVPRKPSTCTVPAGVPLATALERLLRTVVADWEAEPQHADPVFRA